MSGLLLGVPITAAGTVAMTSDPALNLAFTVGGIRLPQVQKLLPTVSLPAVLKVPSAVRVQAAATGRPSQLTVSGAAAAPEMTLACLPWHDVVAEFTWTKNHLTVSGLHAHGSPRTLEGYADVRLGPKGAPTRAGLVMHDVPLDMLAKCVPELKNLKVAGVATIMFNADVKDQTSLNGAFIVRDLRYDKIPLGYVAASFLVGDDHTIRLTNGHLEGPSLTADFSGSTTQTGVFSLTSRLIAADLERLQLPGPWGRPRGRLTLSGSVSAGQAHGHADLLLPTIAKGRPDRHLATDLSVSRTKLQLSNFVLQGGTGRAVGDLTLTDWTATAGLTAHLQLSDVSPLDFLPSSLAGYAPGAKLSGTLDLGGRVTSPTVRADLRAEPLVLPNVGTGSAKLRATYDNGEVTLDELSFESPQGRLQLRGRYTKAGELDLTLPEARADLSLLTPYLKASGVTLCGPALLKGSVRGTLANPTAELEVTSPQFQMNGIQSANLDLSARLADGKVTLDHFNSEFGGGRLTASGSYAFDSNEINLDLTARDVNLSLASCWLRLRAGLAVEGTANADLSLHGTPLKLQGRAIITSPSVLINEVPFSNVNIAADLHGTTLTFRKAQFQQGEGTVNLGGTADVLTDDLNLTVKLDQVNVYPATLVFARAAARLDYLDTTSSLLKFYDSIPGPFEGTLSADLSLTGPYRNPKLKSHAVLDHLTYEGRSLDQITADLAVAPEQAGRRDIAMTVNATQGPTSASVTGAVTLGGETKLALEANDLDLAALAPWLSGAQNLAGRAAVSADVTGKTDDPKLEGTIFVTGFRWGPLNLEAANFTQISLQREVVAGEARPGARHRRHRTAQWAHDRNRPRTGGPAPARKPVVARLTASHRLR